MEIIVTKDSLKIAEKDLVHKGEYNVNELTFTFSEEYEGLSKMAVFSNTLNAVQTAITNNTCIIPAEILLKKMDLTIGVYAYTLENNVLVKRLSPAPITIKVENGSYIKGLRNPQIDNPTLFEQFMEQLEGNIDDLQEQINGKQDTLTAGDNISITDNEISVTGLADVALSGSYEDLSNKPFIPSKTSDLDNDSGFIDNTVNDLVNYELKVDTGHSIELSINQSTYVVTLSLKNSAGTVISSDTVDLPLESVVVDGRYDSATKSLILVLDNGNEITIPVGDLISGLVPNTRTIAGVDLQDDITKSELQNAIDFNTKQNVIDSNNKLASDLVDDTNQTNKFVTETEKTNWNNKSDFSGDYNDLTNKPDLTIYEEKTDAETKYETLLQQIPTNEVSGNPINVQDSSNLPIKDFALLGNATQDSTPTPDTPQDIHVVTGDNTVNVLGKNLFDLSESVDATHYRSLNYIISISNGSLTLKGAGGASSNVLRLQNFSGGKNYTVSFNYTTSPGRILLRLRKRDDTGWLTNQDITFDSWTYNTTYGGWFKNTVASGGKQVLTFTVPECLYWQLGFINLATNDQILSNIQLELGDTNTSYIKYQGTQTQLLSLGNIELAKIGNYTDRIFKAVQGNTIYDSLDSTTKASLTVGKWYKQGNIVKLILNGSESGWESLDSSIPYRLPLPDFILPSSQDVAPYIMNNRLPVAAWNSNSNYPNYFCSTTSSERYARFRNTDVNNLASFKTWLSTNNIYLYYATSAPTYTEIE